jgi:hypothetical protein
MEGTRERSRGYSSRVWRGVFALLGFAAVIAITVPAAVGVTRHAFKVRVEDRQELGGNVSRAAGAARRRHAPHGPVHVQVIDNR